MLGYINKVHLGGELASNELLESNSIGSELSDTVGELLGGHLVLVEVSSEDGLVIKVSLLLNVEGLGLLGEELLGDGLVRVEQLLEETGGDGQEVATSKLLDLAGVSERSTHDDGLVVELLVVVENVLDGDDTGVLSTVEVLALGGLVPVENSANEGRDKGDLGLGTSNSLDEREEQGQVAVDVVLGLELSSSLDTLVGGGDLDENSVLGDTLGLVEVNELESLLDGGVLVERESGVNLGGDSAGDDLQNLGTELDEELVKSNLNLLLGVRGLALGVGNGLVNELGVLGLLGGGEDERRVGGSILGLVLGDGWVSDERATTSDNTLVVAQAIAYRNAETINCICRASDH